MYISEQKHPRMTRKTIGINSLTQLYQSLVHVLRDVILKCKREETGIEREILVRPKGYFAKNTPQYLNDPNRKEYNLVLNIIWNIIPMKSKQLFRFPHNTCRQGKIRNGDHTQLTNDCYIIRQTILTSHEHFFKNTKLEVSIQGAYKVEEVFKMIHRDK